MLLFQKKTNPKKLFLRTFFFFFFYTLSEKETEKMENMDAFWEGLIKLKDIQITSVKIFGSNVSIKLKERFLLWEIFHILETWGIFIVIHRLKIIHL